MLRKFLSHSGTKTAQQEVKKAQSVIGGRTSKIKHITEIPVTFKVSSLFGGCGLLTGLSLVLVPKRFIESEICLPFPSIHDGDSVNWKVISLFTVCCSCYGWIGGKVYAFKTFRLGDTKRFYRVLGNLANKTPLAVLHCAGFNVTIFYGMFGVFTLIETLIYGEPVYGMDKLDHKQRRNMQYGNRRLMAPNKKNVRMYFGGTALSQQVCSRDHSTLDSIHNISSVPTFCVWQCHVDGCTSILLVITVHENEQIDRDIIFE